MKTLFGILAILISYSVFAATVNPAKEDITPPAAEGILPADKIPPLLTLNNPVSHPVKPEASVDNE